MEEATPTITIEHAPVILDEYCWDSDHQGGWCCIECYNSIKKESAGVA